MDSISTADMLVPRMFSRRNQRHQKKPKVTKLAGSSKTMNITIPARTVSHPRLDRSVGPSSNVPERHPMGTCLCKHIKCHECKFLWPACHTIKYYEPRYRAYYTICTQCEALACAAEITNRLPRPTGYQAPGTPPHADASE